MLKILLTSPDSLVFDDRDSLVEVQAHLFEDKHGVERVSRKFGNIFDRGVIELFEFFDQSGVFKNVGDDYGQFGFMVIYRQLTA